MPQRTGTRAGRAGLGAWGVLVLATGCARQTPQPNLLFVVVDTLRADCVGFLSGVDLTPQLDAFAAGAVVFDHATTPRAKTTPAVASLMTGLYPHDHRVRDLTTPLGSDVPVFAELLRKAGYKTGAILGNFVLRDELSGLARGFDLWVEDLPDVSGTGPNAVAFRGALSITDGALQALGIGPAAKDGAGPTRPFIGDARPWFLWLHYVDPHGSYDPPAAQRRAPRGPQEIIPPAPRPGDGVFHRQWIAEYNVPDEARIEGGIDARVVRELYRGEVRHSDLQIGRLLRELDSAGLLENTLVVFVSDHGESLGEHDYWFEHGRYAYEATCRVPLMIKFPPAMAGSPPPGLSSGDISLADIVPTLTEILRLPSLPPPFRGRSRITGKSRAALLLGRAPRAHPVFCEKIERTEKARAVQSKAVRLGDWKLIRRYTHRVDPTSSERQLLVLSEELYDLAADPREEVNLVAAIPPEAPVRALQEALAEFSAADEYLAELAQILQRKRDDLGREDPETLRALRALGY
jgi:arylsulfatase A-like enzyme